VAASIRRSSAFGDIARALKTTLPLDSKVPHVAEAGRLEALLQLRHPAVHRRDPRAGRRRIAASARSLVGLKPAFSLIEKAALEEGPRGAVVKVKETVRAEDNYAEHAIELINSATESVWFQNQYINSATMARIFPISRI